MDLAEGTQGQDNVPSESAPAGQDAQQEKLLRQSEVNELVGRVKHEAYSKGMRDAQGNTQQSQGSGLGGMPQITDDHVRQLIADEAQKQSQAAAVHQVLTNFSNQMSTGKGKYSDFDETVGNLGDLKNIPHVVQLATESGIAGDVMYELGKNPGKVATLTTLAYVNPHLAGIEMKKLADSIKTNEAAAKQPQADEPLDQVKPSTVGTDNGSNAVRDLRKKSWARG
jgi:hypothetical protein